MWGKYNTKEMEDEYLYSNIMDRMPYFSLETLYKDLNVWYSNSFYENTEYSERYEELNRGEWSYNPEENDIISTVPISQYNRMGPPFYTSLNEIEDFLDYCKYVNSHPIVHPIYTRTLSTNGMLIKYVRPNAVHTGKTEYDPEIIQSIKEIYPEFSLGYISDVISRFGFYDPNVTVGLSKLVGYEYEQDDILDEISDIYAFGPSEDNYGKGIMYSML